MHGLPVAFAANPAGTACPLTLGRSGGVGDVAVAQRDQMIGVQYILSSMGYLTPQNFDGTFGKATLTAIKAFQKANGLP